MLRSQRVDSRSCVSCAAARLGTAAARRRIRWPRFSSSRCSSLEGRRGIGGSLVSSRGRRGGGGDHGMHFCPPASSLLRWRQLPRLREACEVGSWSSSSVVVSVGGGGVATAAFPSFCRWLLLALLKVVPSGGGCAGWRGRWSTWPFIVFRCRHGVAADFLQAKTCSLAMVCWRFGIIFSGIGAAVARLFWAVVCVLGVLVLVL